VKGAAVLRAASHIPQGDRMLLPSSRSCSARTGQAATAALASACHRPPKTPFFGGVGDIRPSDQLADGVQLKPIRLRQVVLAAIDRVRQRAHLLHIAAHGVQLGGATAASAQPRPYKEVRPIAFEVADERRARAGPTVASVRLGCRRIDPARAALAGLRVDHSRARRGVARPRDAEMGCADALPEEDRRSADCHLCGAN
jgi:hypothetical protein